MVEKIEPKAEPVLNRCICGSAPAFSVIAETDELCVKCECGRTQRLNRKISMTDDHFKNNLAMVWNNNVGKTTAVADKSIEAVHKSCMPVALKRYQQKVAEHGSPPEIHATYSDIFRQGFGDGFCEAVYCILNGQLEISAIQVGGD